MEGGRELTRSQEKETVGLEFEPSQSLDVRVSVGGAPESGPGLGSVCHVPAEGSVKWRGEQR